MRGSDRARPSLAALALAAMAGAASPGAPAQEGLKPAANEDRKLPPDKPADREIGQRRPGDAGPLEFFPPPADPSQVPGPMPGTLRQTLPAGPLAHHQALGFKFRSPTLHPTS